MEGAEGRTEDDGEAPTLEETEHAENVTNASELKTTSNLLTPRASMGDVVVRDEVVREIIASERKYIDDLNVIIEVFIKPLKKLDLLSKEAISSIFGTVEILVAINCELFAQLEERGREWDSTTRIGDVFLMLAPHFKIYTSYCKNYEVALNVLQQAKRSSPQFAAWLEQTECKRECHQQDLISFLIMPVQRIPRYILLLRELLSRTPTEHPDYENLQRAVEQYALVTKTVNESIRSAERAAHVVGLQKKFAAGYELIRPARIFYKDGPLHKITSRFVKETWFFLFNDVLVYAYDNFGTYHFKGEIPLGTTWIRDLYDTPTVQNAFQIVSKKKTYTVYAATTEDKNSWVVAINKCINKIVSQKPHLIEERAGVQVQRSWLSSISETMGLTYTPRDFDPHGAGFSDASMGAKGSAIGPELLSPRSSRAAQIKTPSSPSSEMSPANIPQSPELYQPTSSANDNENSQQEKEIDHVVVVAPSLNTINSHGRIKGSHSAPTRESQHKQAPSNQHRPPIYESEPLLPPHYHPNNHRQRVEDYDVGCCPSICSLF